MKKNFIVLMVSLLATAAMAQVKEKWKGRGTATIYEDDSIEFKPTGNGQQRPRIRNP